MLCGEGGVLSNLMDKGGDAEELQVALGQQLLYGADVIPRLPHVRATFFLARTSSISRCQ